MDTIRTNLARQIAEAARLCQQQRTGYAPQSVTVALGEGMLVITLHGALTPAERVLAQSAAGAAQVQEFHRRLFASSSDALRQEIKRITGLDVLEAAAEVEPATGAVVHAFTSGSMVQVFHLAGGLPVDILSGAALPADLKPDCGKPVGPTPPLIPPVAPPTRKDRP